MAEKTSSILKSISVLIVLATGGCGLLTVPTESTLPTGLAGEVASKAVDIGELIGGSNGFGGTLLTGYAGHMDQHMGFHSAGDLAQEGDQLLVRLNNDSNQDSTFLLRYMASQLGSQEQTLNVDVGAGEFVDVTLPCAEIIGLGSLTEVGDVAVELENSVELDNAFCVPGFLGSDFTCGAMYECFLTPDVNDLDQDGDTEELIVTTDALLEYLDSTEFGWLGGHMGMGMGLRFP